jgi:hypothetical protein
MTLARIAFCFMATCLGSIVQAREVNDWDYATLSTRADLIAIGTRTSTKSVDFDFSRVEPWRSILALPRIGPQVGAILVAEVTEFDVAAILKGEIQTRSISVFHFSFSKDQQFIENGPHFFREGLLTPRDRMQPLRKDGPYLLFLKRNSDGRFEPVTGQDDGAFSVRLLRSLVHE